MKSDARIDPPVPTGSPKTAPLEEVVITSELACREARAPDFAAENRALIALAKALSGTPQALLHKLCDTARELCHAQSAGISVLEEVNGRQTSRWYALSGAYERYRNVIYPIDLGPCGIAIERNAPQLFRHPEQYYVFLQEAEMIFTEGLVLPVFLDKKPVGTLWVGMHEEGRQFDAEDVRLLTTLAEYAAVARKMMLALEAQSRLTAIVENARDAIMSFSLEGQILGWNQGAELVFGYTAQEALGRKADFLVPAGKAEETAWLFNQVRRGQAVSQYETMRLRKDGRRIEVSTTFSPMIVDGQIVAVSALVRDITIQKQAERALQERERRINEILEGMTEGFLVLDRDWRICAVNRAAAKMSGKPREDMLGRSHWEEWPSLVGTELEAAYRRALKELEPVHLEYHYQDGEHDAWLEINAYPTEENLGIFYHDITERKEGEIEISALNARLRQAMTETHHRVKNNLQLVAGLIDLQAQSGRETVPMSNLEWLGQNIQALGVIHDILTQDTRGEGDGSRLSVKRALEQFLPMLQMTLGERRLLATLDEISLPGKQTAYLVLVANELISNATKHGRGDITLMLRLEGEQATLEVCDDGPGFAPDFDPVTAANIGLDLIESMSRYDLGAGTAYENRPEGGARVVITFSAAPESVQTAD